MLLLGEYDYYPIAHHFLNHALDFNVMLHQEKACTILTHLGEYGHHMTSPMSMCFALCKIWHIDLMMCIDDDTLYWADVTYHISISMVWFHDAHEEERGQQYLLLLWLLLNEYGDHPITHNFLIHALCIKDKLQQGRACTSSFGKLGLPILHGGDGGWQKGALLQQLLLG